jgi:hypothetical protein
MASPTIAGAGEAEDHTVAFAVWVLAARSDKPTGTSRGRRHEPDNRILISVVRYALVAFRGADGFLGLRGRLPGAALRGR